MDIIITKVWTHESEKHRHIHFEARFGTDVRRSSVPAGSRFADMLLDKAEADLVAKV